MHNPIDPTSDQHTFRVRIVNIDGISEIRAHTIPNDSLSQAMDLAKTADAGDFSLLNEIYNDRQPVSNAALTKLYKKYPSLQQDVEPLSPLTNSVSSVFAQNPSLTDSYSPNSLAAGKEERSPTP